MALIRIGGVDLPAPSKYTAKTVDIVDSGRNALGEIVSDVIRSDVAKISIVWNYLTLAEWANICKIFKNSFINSVTFLNQTTGIYETRNMYISDRDADTLNYKNGLPHGWRNCKLSLVEV